MTTIPSYQRGQIAPFRVAPPGAPWTPAAVANGPVQAAIVSSFQLQYLTRGADPEGDWYQQDFWVGASIPALAVVAAIVPAAAGQPNQQPTDVHLFVATETGLDYLQMAEPVGCWKRGTTTVASVPALTSLRVTYTPYTGASGNPGSNPVVYGADVSGQLWTVQWQPAGDGGAWAVTSYPVGAVSGADIASMWVAADDFSVVATSETTWVLFGAATIPGFAAGTYSVAGLLGTWTGTFGDSSSPTLVTLSSPTAGSVSWIVGGVVAPGTDTDQNSVNPCAVYIDSDAALMAWPQSLANDAVVAVPQNYCGQGGQTAPAAAVVHGGASAIDLYQINEGSTLYMIHQVTWALDNQLPFFAPASFITGQNGPAVPEIIMPDTVPTNLPSVAVIDSALKIGIWEFTGGGTFDGQSFSGQWTGRWPSITYATAPLAVVTTDLAPVEVGATCSLGLAAGGGIGAYVWTLESGSLPAGLSLAASGVISGVPENPGTSDFTVQVADTAHTDATQALSVTVVATITVATGPALPDAPTAVAYTASLQADGGLAPLSWALAPSSQLPAGLALSTDGVLSGTPTVAGSSSFTVTVSDGGGLSASQTLTLVTYLPWIEITTATSLPAAVDSAQYSAQLEVDGGLAPYTWVLVAGALPGGLALGESDGTISGTCDSEFAGVMFDVQVTESSPQALTVTETFSIATSVEDSLELEVPDAVVGVPYSYQLVSEGGASYVYSLPSGPDWLTVSSSGVLSGTPIAAGTEDFQVYFAEAAVGQTCAMLITTTA